ncbi:MAG: NAD(+)--rifampin ADP-ribosyltransferase [Lewinellaceae bacterium]|nr:NAD(+)--rifampin ADP-ribosyltransferase [Lewinellaceae bacterium]
MEFSPNNPIVKRCLQGMAQEDQGNPEEAIRIFQVVWNEATNDFERFLAAYYIARQQKDAMPQLQWLETAVHHALKTNNLSANSALPNLYLKLAACCEHLGKFDQAENYTSLATAVAANLSDTGPFYHGTRADMQIGDLLTAGYRSNYQSDIIMNHIYFTALINGAGLAAALATGDGQERVYIVEPTGKFENDPNVTDKKFPGNPTRSYRTSEPLKIVGEINDWVRITPEELKHWREKLANNQGKIIN